MIALLLPAALAAGPVLGAGAEATVNDPFWQTSGVRAAADVTLRPWLRLGLSGGLYPGVVAQERALTSQLVDYGITPDISRMGWRAAGQLTVLPLRQVSGERERVLGAVVGMGAVYTEDDLERLQAVGDPEAEATARQLHPITHVGLIGEVWWGDWGGRLRMERSAYTEVIFEVVQESKVPAWVGVDIIRRWP